MADVHARVLECFALVFPGVPEDALAAASPATLEAWDSMAVVTLVAVLEEEFRVSVPFEDLERLLSFADVEAYVGERV